MRCTRLILAILATLCSCSSNSTAPPKTAAAVPVLTAIVKVMDVPLFLESIGVLYPSAIVEVRPQVGGMLQEIHFKEGAFVEKGSPLFTIDPATYRIKLEEIEAQFAQDKITLAHLQKKLERYQKLTLKDLVSQQEVDELVSLVGKQEALVRGDEARRNAALLDLEHCTLCAPIKGRVGKLHVHSGNLVSSSQAAALVTLASTDPLVVEFTLTEGEFYRLTTRNLPDNYPIHICPLCPQACGLICEGNLAFLDHQFDRQSGLLLVKGLVKNPQHRLFAGQSVKVRVPMSVVPEAKVIPQRAVKINQQGPYVYVVGDDLSVAVRQVVLGVEIDDAVVIVEGLEAHENVVTEGHLRLAPGMKVEVKS